MNAAATAARDYRVGFGLTLLGVVLITPDALIVRLIATDPWTMVFWRGVLISTAFMTFMCVRIGPAAVLNGLRSSGRPGIAAIFCHSITAVGFMLALSMTSVANTLVLLAASPLFAALMSWILLKERVPAITWVAILAGIGGIAIVVSEGFLADGSGNLHGDLIALMSSVSLAAILVLARRRKDINMVPNLALGGYLAAAISVPFAAPFALTGDQALLVFFLCAILLPTAFSLIISGPRRLPAAEVSLLLLLESVIGPIWAWLFIGEEPGRNALIGGGIVIGALTLHGLWNLHRRRTA